MSTHIFVRTAGVCLAAILAAGHVDAQSPGPSGNPPPGGERRGPPAESIAACKSHKVDQICSFTSPKRAERGICVQRDASQPVACRPERSGPPPGAIDACNGKALSAECTVTGPEGSAKGRCIQPDASTVLACRPGPR